MPIIAVPKGDGGKWLVINYHALNKVTRKFTWPMPKVEDIFLKLNGAKYFATLDLWPGYHHIPLDKSSIPKTAFNFPFGKYEYIKVPFGLAQAPAHFQDLMTGILKKFDFAIAYLDDIIIFSRTVEEHLSHIKQVFVKLRNATLYMKFSKCHFFTKEIQYLGHILSTKDIQPLPSKIQAIQTMHPPKTPKQVHDFLGLVGYYRKFIKNCAKIAKPLTLLTWQQVKFDWTPTHHETFLKLKESIIEAPIPRSQQEVHSLYWCIRWCLWSAAIPGTWWYWILHCLSLTYLFIQKMEHHQTWSLQSLLCHYQMELLSPGNWYHSAKWSQATQQIS